MVPSTRARGETPAPEPGRGDRSDAVDWPGLWTRCWSRIRTWDVPPRWSVDDWREEARAQGALAASAAHREFDDGRSVPLEAFLYRRVLEAVWTRYRQEWSFGRRARPAADPSEFAAPDPTAADPDLIRRLMSAFERLGESDRRLIRDLYWDGRALPDLARELGTSPDLLRRRKSRAIGRLRLILGIPGPDAEPRGARRES